VRLYLVEALASNRGLILLDEPFRGIDNTARILVSQMVNELMEVGRTVVVAHILASLDPLSIVVLDEGKVVYSGSLYC
jgi:ABC-type multidrug transport system ATPase subunit